MKSNGRLWTFCVALFILLPSTRSVFAFQAPVPPTPGTAQTIMVTPTQTVPQVIGQLNDRIEKLEEEQQSQSVFFLLLEHIDAFIWPLVIVGILFSFRKSVSKFLQNVASVANKASIELSTDGVRWSVPSLHDAIIEREVLKFGILIANTDGDFSNEEREYLTRRARLMKDNLDQLDMQSRKKVLHEIITMATIDGHMHDAEYVAILGYAKQLDIPDEEIIEMILTEFTTHSSVKPPTQLDHRYQQRMHNLRQEQ